MTAGVYVAGTAPRVGKTLLARALTRALVHRGLRTAVMKPVQTGCSLALGAPGPVELPGIPGPVDPEGLEALSRLSDTLGPPPAPLQGSTGPEVLDPSDARALLEAAQRTDAIQSVCPYRFAPALEPAVAARLADVSLDIDPLVATFRGLQRSADVVIVEGSSGLMAPLNPSSLMVDLVQALELPVLLVVPSAPGVISPCLMAIEVLRTRQIPLAGVLLNRTSPEVRPEEAANPYQIERFAGHDVVLGVLPHFDEEQRQQTDFLARRLAFHIDLDALTSTLGIPPAPPPAE